MAHGRVDIQRRRQHKGGRGLTAVEIVHRAGTGQQNLRENMPYRRRAAGAEGRTSKRQKVYRIDACLVLREHMDAPSRRHRH